MENQTDNDWDNVSLSLVSGRPISFIENLYTPLYVPRPTVTPELYASLSPQAYDGGQDAPETAASSSVTVTGSNIPTSEENGVSGGSAPAGAPRRRGMAVAKAMESTDAVPAMAAASPALAPPEINATDSIVPLSETAKLGELFQYTVANVSLARQRSAMIPIINDPMPVERLSIYNESVLGNHPLNGMRLTNDTEAKLHLLQGPVTVFDEGRYAGGRPPRRPPARPEPPAELRHRPANRRHRQGPPGTAERPDRQESSRASWW